jgi:hypothetical protein
MPGLTLAGRAAAGHVVVFQPGTVDPRGLAASILRQVGAAGPRFVYEHSIRGFAANLTGSQVAAIGRDPRVGYVAPDGPVQAHATQAPTPSWGLDRIDQRFLPLDNSYTYMQTGLGVEFHSVDTGVELTHPDFGGRVSTGIDIITPGGTANDCHGHGTFTSGIAGGTVYGVAKQVAIKAVRALDCNGSGTFAQIIAGVDWITANANLPAIANLSLGGGFFQPLNDAVAASVGAGVFYTVSAGSSGSDACQFSPASEPSAYTVAGTTMTDARLSFSNFGTCLDLFAPGQSITSDWLGGGTSTQTGGSWAPPHAAGVAALYLQQNPSATPAQVTAALTTNATPNLVTNPGAGSPNLLLYMGFLNGPPNAPPTAVATASCVAGRRCTLDGTGSFDSDGTIVLYEWLKPNGTVIRTGATFTLNAPPAAAGRTVTLTLRVTDDGGATGTDPVTFTILP